jgi:geranylgeranyl diphosphate synthase type II
MLKEFMSHIREQVYSNINKKIGNSNAVEEIMRYSAMAESKMIRAALLSASGKLNKNLSSKSLVNLSTSVELMHTYSLIHDDLPSMDNDDFRRGKKSSHNKFGEANAILAGDALQSLSYEIICDDEDLTSDEKIAAIKLLTSSCGKIGMVYGQFLDIKNESQSVDEKLIENIHTLKTGKLIECSILLGQLGNSKKNEKNAFRAFGKKIGLAFQITDDILEATSDKETLGKDINSDLKNNKGTYISVLGINKAIDKSKALTLSAISDLEAVNAKNNNMLIELAKYISYREK